MKFEKVKRLPNGPDSVSIDGKVYLIRHTTKGAQHILENYLYKDQPMNFREIVTVIKDSVVLPTRSKKYLAVGKFGGKVYETYFYLVKDRLEVVTCFLSNKIHLIEFYKNYERGI